MNDLPMAGQTNHQVATRILDGMAVLTSYESKTVNVSEILSRIHEMYWAFPQQNWFDAFSRGQIASKMWLIDELKLRCPNSAGAHHWISGDIYVLGGWLGTLAYFMQIRNLYYGRVINIDLDPSVHAPAERLNREQYLDNWRFKSVTCDMHDLKYVDDILPSGVKGESSVRATASLVINTACEHLPDYASWIKGIPSGVRVVLQSNNMFGIDDHVNCKNSLAEFVADCGLNYIEYANTLDLNDSWQRFMIIGSK